MMIKLANSILILLALTTIASSEELEFTEEDIRELKRALDESSNTMESQAKDEDAIIFVGATRSGKSTLINYLIGNELVAEKPYKGAPFAIRKANPKSHGPEIGAGSTSKTTIPSRWTSNKLPQLAIWDSPGFDDNRGSVQDIANAFYLYQLVQSVRTLRIIVAIDINDLLSDNVKPFVSVLNSVQVLLGYKNETHSSILTVIFTKVPDTLNDEPVNMELVSDILSEKILRSGMQLSNTAKDIVEFLINNHDRMAFFKRAKIGKITDGIAVNIFPAIKSSSHLEKESLKELRPSISDRSKVCLYKSRDKILPKKAFSDLAMVINSVIEKKVKKLEGYLDTDRAGNQIGTQITELNRIERQLFSALTHESNFDSKMEIIQTVDADIKRAVEELNLREKMRLTKFVDDLLGMEQSNQLSLNLQAVLLSSETNVREATTSAQFRLGEISRQKHNEIIENERKRHEEEMKRVNKKLEDVEKRDKKTGSNILNSIVKFLRVIVGLPGK